MQSVFQTHLNCHTCSQHYILQCTVHNHMLLTTNLRMRRTQNQRELLDSCHALQCQHTQTTWLVKHKTIILQSNAWIITDNRGNNLFYSLLYIYILPFFFPYSFPILHPPFHFLFSHFLNFQFNTLLNQHIFWF